MSLEGSQTPGRLLFLLCKLWILSDLWRITVGYGKWIQSCWNTNSILQYASFYVTEMIFDFSIFVCDCCMCITAATCFLRKRQLWNKRKNIFKPKLCCDRSIVWELHVKFKCHSTRHICMLLFFSCDLWTCELWTCQGMCS